MTGFTARDRRALYSIAIQFFVNGAILGSMLARVPEVRDQAGISLAQFGVVSSAAGACGLLGSLATATVIGRFGTRRVLIVGAVIQTTSLTAIGFASSGWMLLGALALMSTIDVFVDVSMNLQASWLNARRPTPVMHRIHGLWSLGTLIGGAVAAQLAALGVGLTTHLLAANVALLAALVIVARGLLPTDEQPTRPTAEHPSAGRFIGAWPLFAIAGAAALTAELVPLDWSALRLSEDFDLAPGPAGMGFVAVSVGMTAGRFGGDWLITRLGDGRSFSLSMVVAATGFALAGFGPTATTTIVGFALAGAGIATFFPTIYDAAAQYPGRTGAALGAMTAGSRAAALTVPVIVGTIADSRWSVGTTIGVVALAALALLAAAEQAMRPHDPALPPIR